MRIVCAARLLSGVLGLVFLLGCGGNRAEPGLNTVPVRGKVVFTKGGEVKALFLRQARIELESIAQPGVHAVGPIEEDGSFTVATATAEGSGAGAVPGAHRVRLDLEDNAQKLVAPQFLDFLKSGIVIKVPSDQPIEVKVWR